MCVMAMYRSISVVVILAFICCSLLVCDSYNLQQRFTLTSLKSARQQYVGRMTQECFQLYNQNPDDKINAQIARLNAVAAKLRAEAAELEVVK